MRVSDILAMDGLTVEMLEALSYASELSLSLSRKIKDFPREALLQDLFRAQAWLDEKIWEQDVPIDYRVKSLQSIELKYRRYYEMGRVHKTFNDLLGFRTICDDYEKLQTFRSDERFRIVDAAHGKKRDNGYRGIHLYFQRDSHSYPLEIQYNTAYDRHFNNWLHKHVYKRCPDEVGAYLRQKYEMGEIRTEEVFREVLRHVLLGGETI